MPAARSILFSVLLLTACSEPRTGAPRDVLAMAEPRSSFEVFELDFRHVRADRGDFALRSIMSGGGAVADLDGDGDLDIVAIQSAPSAGLCGLFFNDGQARFERRDLTLPSGGYAMGCAAADFDRDGDTDLFITRDGSDLLLRNDRSGAFELVTARTGLGDEGFGTSAVWFDQDGDGDLDLYVARYIDNQSPEQNCSSLTTRERDYCSPLSYRATHDLLYRNDDGVFVDISRTSGVAGKLGYGLAVIASDFDDDGDIDLYVANDQSPAFLWSNEGPGKMKEVALERSAALDRDGNAIAGMGLVAEDFDGDQDLDLFVTNIRERDHLFLRRSGGVFADVSRRWGEGAWLRPHTGFGVASLDCDLDGRLELFIANGAVMTYERAGDPYAEPDTLMALKGDRLTLSEDKVGGPSVVSRGVACGDLDGDGDEDLVVFVNEGRPRVLLTESSGSGRFLAVAPLDEEGRTVLNAQVSVTVGGRTRLRESRAQESYLSSRDGRHVVFGLGEAERVDSVEVRWPGGGTTRLKDVAGNRVVEVRRGERR